MEYWEQFATHAFENTTQSVHTHCVLLTRTGVPVLCAFCFSIRRDIFDLPNIVIGEYRAAVRVVAFDASCRTVAPVAILTPILHSCFCVVARSVHVVLLPSLSACTGVALSRPSLLLCHTERKMYVWPPNNIVSVPENQEARSVHSGVSDGAGLDLGVLALDAGLDERCVAEDEEERGAEDPKEHAEGRGPPDERDADDKEDGVERLLGDDVLADCAAGSVPRGRDGKGLTLHGLGRWGTCQRRDGTRTRGTDPTC